MSKYTKKTQDYINTIVEADARAKLEADLSKAANRFARKHGSSAATEIDIRRDSRDVLKQQISYGYAKDSTGERVPRSYVNKCRGRGVHYVAAECRVQIGVRDLHAKI